MAHDGGNGSPFQEEAQSARDALSWVMGRLTVLEYLVLGLALVLALGGGALVAWVLGPVGPLSFRWTWAIVSLLLFILPGAFVYLREFRSAKDAPGPKANSETTKELKESNG